MANLKEFNVNFDDEGKIVNITEKIHDSASASLYEVIVKIWDNYDADKDGKITVKEARLFVDDIIQMNFIKYGLDKKVLFNKAFEKIDQNCDGEVDM